MRAMIRGCEKVAEITEGGRAGSHSTVKQTGSTEGGRVRGRQTACFCFRERNIILLKTGDGAASRIFG